MSNIVNIYRNTNSIVTDAFDSAVFNICMHKERHGYNTFYLCGCEPRVGTTCVAVELSVSLALSGWKTLLLDGNLRKDNSYKRLNEESRVGLADYLMGYAVEEEIVHETNWDNLSYISCGNIEDNPLKMLYSAKMANLTKNLSSSFDYVIIDGPSITSSVDSDFYSLRSDATILIAAMDGSQKKHLESAYNRLIKNEANVIGVIENKVSMTEYRDYNKDYDYFKNKKFISKKKSNSQMVSSAKIGKYQDKGRRILAHEKNI